jgi:hypothetical protein
MDSRPINGCAIGETEMRRNTQRTLLLTATTLLLAANAMAATSGTQLDAPVNSFGTLMSTTIAFLTFIVGSLVAMWSMWRHGELSHTLAGAAVAVVSGAWLAGITPIANFFGITGALIR